MLVSSIALVWDLNSFGRMALAVDEQNQKSDDIFQTGVVTGSKFWEMSGRGKERERVQLGCDEWGNCRGRGYGTRYYDISLAELSSSASPTDIAMVMYFRLAGDNVMSWRVKYQKP